MSKGCAGIIILEKGIIWRNEFLSGNPIQNIASKYKTNSQIVSRAIWLAKIPDELKLVIKENPEIFTREILINQFASKRAQCEKNSFAFLRSEILRMVKEGMGSKPKFPMPKRQKKTPSTLTSLDNQPKTDTILNIREAMEAEYKIKQALGYNCRVLFSKEGGGEIKIFFKDNKSLETIIQMMQPSNGLF